ncbi:MAG: hypothetical protein HWE21_12125 [Cytophagia bacterium]|nr:hypothetical protein [Cytophagia bacterium]
MKTKTTFKIVCAFLLITAFVVSCAASGTPTNSTAKADAAPKAYNPAGVWEYMVDTPDGGSTGTMRISGSPGAFTASLETDQFGTLEVSGVNVQDTNMTGNIEVMGTSAQIECQFDGDSMTGAVYLGQDVFSMSGKRVSK